LKNIAAEKIIANRLHRICIERGVSACSGHIVGLLIVALSAFLTTPLKLNSWISMLAVLGFTSARLWWGLKFKNRHDLDTDKSRKFYFLFVIAAALSWALVAISIFSNNGFADLTLITTLLIMVFVAAGSTASLGPDPVLGASSSIILLSCVTTIIAFSNSPLVTSILILAILAFGILVIRQFWLHENALKHSITNEIAAQERAAQLNILLEERSRYLENQRRLAIADLTSGVAHEINNPLTILMGRQYLLKSYVDSSTGEGKSTAVESLEIMQQTTHRISGIIGTMKLLNADVDPDEIPDSAASLINDCISQISNRTLLHGVNIEFNSCEVGGELIKYGAIFKTCISAVLENGIIAAKMSTNPNPLVKITAKISDSNLHIVVTDNGPGINRVNHESIFNPFMTTRDPGKGLGLGLSIARNLSEKCGGSLKIISPSAPTSFEITTPLA
jgi:signal transduction histidine kinase